MKQILHIFLYKIRYFFVVTATLTPASIFKNVSSSFVYIGFAFGMYKVSYAALSYMAGPLHLNAFLIHRLIAIVLFIFFLTVNAGNILVSLTGLFRSAEINFLLTKPVPYANVFLVKFFDNFFFSSSTLLMIIFAVLLAYGNFYGVSPLFYVVIIGALFLPFMLIAGLIGVLMLFGMLFAAKKVGLKATVAALVALYIASTVLFFVGNDPPQVLERAIANEQYAVSLFSSMESPILKLLPNYWVANGMYHYIRDEYLQCAWYVFCLLLTFACLTTLNYIIARKFFYSAYQIAQTVKFRKEDEQGTPRYVAVNFFAPWKRMPVFIALLRREAALFFRDVAQVMQSSFLILLIVLFVSSVSYRPQMIFRSLNPQLQTVIYLIFFLFNSFMITSIALRFVFPLQSLEGESYWRVRSAPVNFKAVIYWRFAVYCLIILFLAQGLNIFSHRRFSSELLIFSTVLTFFMTVAITAVNYSFGIYFVNYREKNPIRIASSQGASTAFLICLFYLAVVIGILFPVLRQYFLSTQNLRSPFTIEAFFPVMAVISLLSIAITAVCLFVVGKQLKGDAV